MITTKIITPAHSAYSYQLLISRILEQPLKYKPNTEIVYRNISRYTYKDLYKRVSKLANLLTEHLAVKPGETVAIVDYDSHRYLEGYFAIPMIGAVLHTINFRLSSEEILYTINHAEDKVIFCHKDFLPLLENLQDKMQTVNKIVVTSDDDKEVVSSIKHEGEYEALLSRQKEEYKFPDFDENSIATIFFTTGTTGLPKGVYFSHRQLVLHTLGLTTTMGAMDSTVKINLTDWKMISGGSALPKGLAKKVLSLGINVIIGYGMSETCPVISLSYLDKQIMNSLNDDEKIDMRLKAGIPIHLSDVKLRNDAGEFVANDGMSQGEVVVRAPWTTTGYYNDPKHSEELWKDGYLHTGDIARIDKAGVITITDRKKDVIKSGGEWVSSLLVENLLSSYHGITEVAVVAIPDDKWIERPLAVVVPKPNENITRENLNQHLQQFVDSGKIKSFAIPKEYLFVAELPMTSAGKIDKKKIRASISQNRDIKLIL